MGFDLTGINAKNKKGEYFRNNVWYWRPLWDYVCVVCDKILSKKDKENGEWNNGHTINAIKAEKITKALEESIQNGFAKTYSLTHKEKMKTAIANNKKAKPDRSNWDWNENYPFTLSNLKEFITFIKNSEGFQIY